MNYNGKNGSRKGGEVMKLIAKILGLIIKVVLYPFAWILEWTLLFMAMLFDKIDDLSETDK